MLPEEAFPVRTGKKKPKPWVWVCVAAGALAVTAIVVFLAMEFNPVSRMMRSLKNGDSETAMSIAEDRIAESDRLEEDATEELSVYANEILQQYRDGQITYDEADAKMTTIASAGLLTSDVLEAATMLEEVHYANEQYETAVQAAEDGDYKKAIYAYRDVIELNVEHVTGAEEGLASAVSAYRDGVVVAVGDYMAASQFDVAAAAIQEGLSVLAEDAELTQLQNDCADAEYQFQISQMIAEADVYADTHDYQEALNCIDQYLLEYPDETALLNARAGYVQQYTDYVIQTSKDSAAEGDYETALSLTNSYLTVLESPEITALQLAYASYIPVQLGDMEFFLNKSEGGDWAMETDTKDAYLEDNYGNQYSHSFYCETGSVTYLLNYKYASFTGTVAFPKGLDSDSYRYSATLKIIGDDDTELAVFSDFDADSRPETFSLDVSGYEKLTLHWGCSGMNIWHNWGYFATIFDGILTPIPLEIPS